MRVPPSLSLVSRLGVSALWLGLQACGVFNGGTSGPGSASGSAASGARVEQRQIDRHPPLNLVIRAGDPQPALAFASVHDQGSPASVALSALMLARLRAHGIADVQSTPSANGLVIAVLCANATAARSFIDEVSAALSTPLAEHDAAWPTIAEHLAALLSRTFAGPAEAAVADCAAELGQAPGAVVPDLRTASGRAEVERYRAFAYASRASAFAALGSAEFDNAAAEALRAVPDWPSGDAVQDAWPTADRVGIDAAVASDSTRRLSLAWRVSDAEAALSAVPRLTAQGSPLTSRLLAFVPGFHLDRVAFRARPRGACVRVDVALPSSDPAPTSKEVAVAASIVGEEVRVALAGQPRRALEDDVVEPSDPRQAAGRAAYRALVLREEPGPERRVVALDVRANERTAFSSFAADVRAAESGLAIAPIELRSRTEAGQGELWLLVGSPCGTLAESNEDAGETALALTMAARNESDHVTLEPWLTSDAVGLLAHATREPAETSLAQALRVARALGGALGDRDARGDAFANAQGELLTQVGGLPRPAYARLLEALSPDHSAWLDPHGNFRSIGQASRDAAWARSRELLRGPLRIAVIGNQDDAQTEAAAHSLERWLAPFRDQARRCQASAERAAQSGEIALSLAGDEIGETAYIGRPFASRKRFEREAQALLQTLNAPAGPLARALSDAHVDASARASVIGGDRAAALVVEVRARDDDARAALLEARRALTRAVQTPLTDAELVTAQRSVEQHALALALDPRRRIVDLWRGSGEVAPLSRASLRAFQLMLAASAEVVVSVTHRE